MKNLNYLMHHILYQIFRYSRLFWIYIKKAWGKTINPSIRIYIKKIENGITFKIKTGYYLELLTPEIMKLLRNTKSNVTINKNGENVSYLEITEVVLIHCNVSNNSYQQNSRVLYNFVSNKSFGQLLDILPKNLIFLKLLTQNTAQKLSFPLRISSVNVTISSFFVDLVAFIEIFNEKLHFLCREIFIYWGMVYWSNFQTTRERR